MNHYQQILNRKLGEQLRVAREKKGLTQEGFRTKIGNLLENDVLKMGFTKNEYSLFLCGELDSHPALKRRMHNAGIRYIRDYKPPAVSTISKYENGMQSIPADFLIMAQKILGKFDI